jgi:hypothetical protein
MQEELTVAGACWKWEWALPIARRDQNLAQGLWNRQ